jgi:hypothetical protein
MIDRGAATTAVIERFRNKEFSWKTQGNCIHLARAQAAAMGHKVPIVPQFRSAFGAAKALKATGHNSVISLLDSMLPRIVPAMAVIGDIVALATDERPVGGVTLEALAIHSGTNKLLGWRDGASGIVAVEVTEYLAAWRL